MKKPGKKYTFMLTVLYLCCGFTENSKISFLCSLVFSIFSTVYMSLVGNKIKKQVKFLMKKS